MSPPSAKQPDNKITEEFLANALKIAEEAADGASEILLSHYGRLSQIEEKKFQEGLVSEADRASEQWIAAKIKEHFPKHNFLGEEGGLTQNASTDGEGTWIVDPLDGTTNYVHQFPFFCVSIALEINHEVVVGVIDAPKLGWRYHAVRGKGAYMNGKPIHVSKTQMVKDALFATGFSSADERLEDQFKLLKFAIQEARGIRRAGAAALDLCMVAQGVFDCFWEKKLKPWDTAAGSLIAKEAGALVTDLKGEAYVPRMSSLLAATPEIHRAVIRELQNH